MFFRYNPPMSESASTPPKTSAIASLPTANSETNSAAVSAAAAAVSAVAETPSPLQLEEVEQALLGAMLRNNRVYDDLADRLSTEDFHHPAHQIIYKTLGEQALRGQQANALTLAYILSDDEALSAQGGAEYLSYLENALLPSVPKTTPEYSETSV